MELLIILAIVWLPFLALILRWAYPRIRDHNGVYVMAVLVGVGILLNFQRELPTVRNGPALTWLVVRTLVATVDPGYWAMILGIGALYSWIRGKMKVT